MRLCCEAVWQRHVGREAGVLMGRKPLTSPSDCAAHLDDEMRVVRVSSVLHKGRDHRQEGR